LAAGALALRVNGDRDPGGVERNDGHESEPEVPEGPPAEVAPVGGGLGKGGRALVSQQVPLDLSEEDC
jgi:hypothetical protein